MYGRCDLLFIMFKAINVAAAHMWPINGNINFFYLAFMYTFYTCFVFGNFVFSLWYTVYLYTE